MSPFPCSSAMSACTPAWCRGSVVRMKSSLVIERVRHSSWYRLTTRSASSLGRKPCCFAVRSIFWPCSSVPVRKRTSRPHIRLYLATVSATTVV